MQNEQDYYSMYHITGLIKCWEDLVINNKDLKSYVNRIRKQYFARYKPIREYIYDTLDSKQLLEICEKIYTGEISTE